MRDENLTVDEIDSLLNQQSDLLGVTGTNNLAQIGQRVADGKEARRKAIQVFAPRASICRRLSGRDGRCRCECLNGCIDENSARIRHRVERRFNYLGASFDADRNREANVLLEQPVLDISLTTSRVKVSVIAAIEEVATADAINAMLNSASIPIAVSAHREWA